MQFAGRIRETSSRDFAVGTNNRRQAEERVLVVTETLPRERVVERHATVKYILRVLEFVLPTPAIQPDTGRYARDQKDHRDDPVQGKWQLARSSHRVTHENGEFETMGNRFLCSLHSTRPPNAQEGRMRAFGMPPALQPVGQRMLRRQPGDAQLDRFERR